MRLFNLKYIPRVILFLIILTLEIYTQTDKIHFKHITDFPGGAIWCLLQDSKGFLWIGTYEGLYRYDGSFFKIYKNSPENENSLGANNVRSLFEDRSGNLWVGTDQGGLNRYNSSSEEFKRYVNDPANSRSLSSNVVLSIYEDKSGLLWIGTLEGGLNLFNQAKEEFITYRNDPEDSLSLSNNRVRAIFEDSKGNFWIGTVGGGLNKFDRQKKTFTRYIHNPNNPFSVSHNNITGIREDDHGALWISTMRGGLNKLIYQSNKQNQVFIHYKNDPDNSASLSNNNISTLFIDSENEIWIGTWGGGLNKAISNMNSSSALSFVSYKNDPFDQFSLDANNVNHIYEDKTGLIWVATWDGGLNIINKNQLNSKYYKHEPQNPFSLSANGITAVYEDRSGILWIGTQLEGLNKMDRATNKFTHYKNKPGDAKSISDNSITTIYEDKSGTFWIGTWNGGLNKFDRKTEKFHHYKYNSQDSKSISDDRILSISEYPTNTLWIGTYHGGLNKFEIANESFINYKHNPTDSNSISSNRIPTLYTDDSGSLWIGTIGGSLDEFDINKEKFFHYNFYSDQFKKSSTEINSIYQDKSGYLWIGTFDKGLIKLNKKNGEFRIYNTQDGLLDNYVAGILGDDRGNLWISSIGLSKFNPQTESFINFDYENGFYSSPYGQSACYKSKTGELIFGGANGFSMFYPDSIKYNTNIPQVYITAFYLYNKPVPIGFDRSSNRTILTKSIIECEKIELNFDDKVFSFEFSALDFHSPLKNKYAYRLEGFDNNWTYTDANPRLVTYTNLDPGEYTFRVMASNNDGIWNTKGAAVQIIILPPWWKTSWAYLLYFIAFGTTLYTIWKLQLKRIRIKHEIEMKKLEAQKLHEVDELKSRFFTNISHEFRTPLTLILGPAKKLLETLKDEKAKEDLDLIHRSARKLNKLVNELLDISKIEAGEMKLEASPQNFVSLAEDIVLQFYTFAETKNISLRFNSEQKEILAYLDNDKFDKILTNILANAIKFTPEGGKVEVEIIQKEKTAEIIVRDTGIGIAKDQIHKVFKRFYQVNGTHTREKEGTGIGLALTKELLEIHHGKIEVESEEGKGSTFKMIFPLGKDHLKSEEICKEKMENSISDFEPDELIQQKNKFKADIEVIDKKEKSSVLIIEDNVDVRKYLTGILHSQYIILEAQDGEEGLNKSFKHLPDLIICDIMMPKIDGFQLCRKLKNDSRTSHIPLIMLTAKATIKDKLDGLAVGADDYIMKPFEASELLARIKNILQQRKRLHEHFRKYELFETEEKTLTSIDIKFIQKTVEVANNNLSNTELGVELLAHELSVSKSVLNKKLSALTGDTPAEFIKRIRLSKAAKLIQANAGNISEIALEVGFRNPAYFAECFKKQFGVIPSQYHSDIISG